MKHYKFSEPSEIYRQGMEGDALRAFGHFKGDPCSLLEIGVFEGGSAVWFLDNILTHPDSDYIGVDDNIRSRAKGNISQHDVNKWILIHGDSNKILPSMLKNQFTFSMIYIDGCHHVDYALNDLKNSLELIRHNGVILIDDYEHTEYGLKEPIDTFLSGRTDVEVLFRTYRIAIRKVSV